MKLLIERDNLLDALTRSVGVVDNKSGVEILSHCLLTAAANTLLIRATNQIIEVTVPAVAEVSEQGLATCDANALLQITKKMPKGGQIAIAHRQTGLGGLGGGELKISSGRSVFRLPTLPVEDFPQLSVEGGDEVICYMTARQLRTLIDATRFAISTDETRYYLNGIYLHVDGETLVAVATNGHELSRKSIPLPPQAHALPGIIIPRATAGELLKFLPDNEAEIEVCVSPRLLKVTLGNAELISKLIDGTFPDYRRVIPQPGQPVIAPREQLLAAIQRVAVVLEGDKGITLRIKPDEVIIGGRAANMHGRDAVCDVTWDGLVMSVRAAAGYLEDALGALGGAQVAIMPGDGNGAMRFEAVDSDGSHLVVLMPMSGAEMLEDEA